MTKTQETQEIRGALIGAIAEQDQRLAFLRDHAAEVRRLVGNGPESDNELEVILRCVEYVRGELLMSWARRTLTEHGALTTEGLPSYDEVKDRPEAWRLVQDRFAKLKRRLTDTEEQNRAYVEGVMEAYEQRGGQDWLAGLPDKVFVQLFARILPQDYRVSINGAPHLSADLSREIVSLIDEMEESE